MSDVSCVQVGSELKTLEKLLCTEYETIRFDKRRNTSLRTDLYIHFLRLALALFAPPLRLTTHRALALAPALDVLSLRYRFADDGMIYLDVVCFCAQNDWFLFRRSEHPREICSCDA